MTIPMEKLLPCPFCGRSVQVIFNEMTSGKNYWDINCSHNAHSVLVIADSEIEAIAAWNTRELLQPAPVDAPEEGCNGCPKDADCDDYRTDGNPCEGKAGWFKCEQCGKLLPTQNGLEKHKRYHFPVNVDVLEAVKTIYEIGCFGGGEEGEKTIEAVKTLIRAATKNMGDANKGLVHGIEPPRNHVLCNKVHLEDANTTQLMEQVIKRDGC